MSIALAERDLYNVLQVDPAAHPNVITAAYRALARLAHPDQTGERTDRIMATLNGAYAILSDPEQRRAYDRDRTSRRNGTAGPAQRTIVTPPPRSSPRPSSVLPHGRYQGWSLEQLLRRDEDYLRWLARHPSGRRYRDEIEQLLARSKVSR